MLFVLEYNKTVWLAAYRAGRFIQSEWQSLKGWEMMLTGLNLDTVRENVISQISGKEMEIGGRSEKVQRGDENYRCSKE
jgi:hypothetical protein